MFTYFNNQTHDRNLKQLEQDLRFRADRRLKIFDLKASEYSKYVANLDDFGKKNQIELPERMQPIMDQYLQSFLSASETGDKNLERQAITWLSSQISALMQESTKDLLKLKYESNRLKLIATDEMLDTFRKIETSTQALMDCTNTYMSQYTEIMLYKQTDKSEAFQIQAASIASDIQQYSDDLLNQMRLELSEI